uniref:Integral membrane protein 2 n=1 Tax=Periophthalmus magnuspinnatus TaxID=409849 RepID=A0A3B4AGV2_9GOBI
KEQLERRIRICQMDFKKRCFRNPCDAEAVVSVRHQSRAWCWCMCLGLALMLSGVVVGGAYLYRYYITGVFYCGVNYREEDFMMLEDEQVQLCEEMLTAYLDLSLNKCYVIPLNTSIVMPPRDLLELLVNVKAGTYLPQSYLVHEEMVVTERIENVNQLGFFIFNLCRGKETFRLQRRDRIPGNTDISHFENIFVMETMICED